MQVLVELLAHGFDDGAEPVTRVLAADATGEIDEAPPVDVDHARTVGVGDDQPGVETPALT